MPEGWVHDEINAVVEAYFILLDRYQASQPLNKAQVIRILRQGPLFGRTGASISRKFENINAILKEHGSPRLPGHAAHNVQKALRMRVLEYLEYVEERPTADPVELERRVAALRARGPSLRPSGHRAPQRTARQQSAYARNPMVKAWVLQEAKGRCELCMQPGPFQLSDGELFLEVHHVRPLTQDGPDTTDNAVAVCPNCHRRLHLANDAQEQRERLYTQVPRLVGQ